MTGRHSMISSRRRKRMLGMYIVFLLILTLGIVLMPIGSTVKEKTMVIMYVSGVFFWIGIAGTIYMALKINSCRKNSYRFNEQAGNEKQFGLIHFFQNREAKIIDVVMFVSIIGFIITKICTSELIISFILLALFVFSFGMHCMLNGINYRYLKYKVRREES